MHELNLDPELLEAMSKIVRIENNDSDTNALYRIFDPLQVTVEYCTGLTPGDSYGFSVFSANGKVEINRSIDPFFTYINKRPPHRHDYYELVIVLDGEIIQIVEGKEYVYRSGTCFLLNRNVRHIERFTGRVKVFSMAISADFLSGIIEEAPYVFSKEDYNIINSSIFSFIKYNSHNEADKEYLDFFPALDNFSCAETLEEITGRLAGSITDSGVGSVYFTKGTLCQLLLYMSSQMNIIPVKLNTSADSLLFMRVQRLLEQTNGRISRSELAERLNYNGSYINDVVQKHTGKCLFDYGMTFCFSKAEELLKKSDLSVSEICARLNFTNRTHFYSLFQERYGMTPKEYRDRQSGKSS